jgi:hypothetical protein
MHAARDVVVMPRQVHVPRPNPERLDWPVVRTYVPIEEVWQATGLGTAGVIREKSNGKWAVAFFWLSLMEDGLVSRFGDEDTTPEAVASLLEEIGTKIPPMQAGSIDQAAAYVWGAYVLSQTQAFCCRLSTACGEHPVAVTCTSGQTAARKSVLRTRQPGCSTR